MENTNQNADPASGQGAGEKLFTQEQVNTIVQDRLAKEKAKYEKQIADMQAEVKQREKRMEAREKLSEKGLPAELIDLIRLEDDQAFKTSLELLERTYKQGRQELPKEGAATKRGYVPKGGISAAYDPIRGAMGLE